MQNDDEMGGYVPGTGLWGLREPESVMPKPKGEPITFVLNITSPPPGESERIRKSLESFLRSDSRRRAIRNVVAGV